MGALEDFWNSERGLMAIVLILGSTVLMALGKMTTEQWLDFQKWLVAFYVASKTVTGSVALMKGSGDPAAKPNTPAPPASSVDLLKGAA